MFKGVNRVIKVLVYSDFILNYGWGFLSPIFSLFIAQEITNGNLEKALEVAGLSAFFYWIPKSILQIPIARYLDKNHGEKDDFTLMLIGTFMTGIVPIMYLLSTAPWHIYLAQIVHSIAMALVIPAWTAIFTRHIDKGKEALEWSLWSTFVGVGAGIAAAMGGVATAFLGFKLILAFVGLFTFLAAILLIFIRKQLFSTIQATHIGQPVKTPNEEGTW